VSIDDPWYKNAIIYCLDVEKYQDATGDGVGDFEGLMRRLDYLAGLGATCVWLQPFYPSPNRDNGYDVVDYYNVHEKHGSLGDFVNFMNHASALGLRVIVDLVVNHTSVDCPGSRGRAPIRSPTIATGMSGPTSAQKITSRASSFPGNRRRRGRSIARRSSTTFTVSIGTRPISTPGTRTCAPRSKKSWASGCSSASPDSAWTRCRS
jgi:hypothetical protein